MKSTNERLAESYCRPKTEEEWQSVCDGLDWGFDVQYVLRKYNGGAVAYGWIAPIMTEQFGRVELGTEIPVSHFTDLMHDRLATWRLEEDGFVFYASTGQHVLHTNGLKRYHVTLPPISNTVKVDVWNGDKGIEADNVTTYTDLITLIRLIG